MTFMRTIPGLDSLYLFKNVDVVVFTEGGQSSYSEQLSTNFSQENFSIDQLFWNSIFQKHSFKKKYCLLSIGSKTSLTEIASAISGSESRTVCVAMDTDLDELDGKKILSPNVLYTYGYSWENDVYEVKFFKQYVKENIVLKHRKSKLEKQIEEDLEGYFCGCTCLAEFNYCYHLEGEKDIHYKEFEIISNKKPSFNMKKLENYIFEERKKLTPQRSIPATFSGNDRMRTFIRGKWVHRFCYQVLVFYETMRLCFKSGMHTDRFQREFIKRYSKSSTVKSFSYYQEQIFNLERWLDRV